MKHKVQIDNMHPSNADLHPEAQTEYEEHLLYYAASGFSFTTLEDFRAEIDAAFNEIAANPMTYRLVRSSGKQRRFGPTKKFRFVIYYVVRPETKTPYILAVAHPSRKPSYWAARV